MLFSLNFQPLASAIQDFKCMGKNYSYLLNLDLSTHLSFPITVIISSNKTD